MDRASLAARIQEILKSRPRPVGQASPPADAHTLDPTDEGAAFARRCAAAEASSRVLEILGATVTEHEAGACVVVDRHYPLTHVHGRHPVERFHSAASHADRALPWFLREREAADDRSALLAFVDQPLLFFDLETTGLSGGAGTYAFLVGFGFFHDAGFSTRQFFLRGFGEERALLHAVARHVGDHGPGRTGADTGRLEADTDRLEACPTGPVLVSYNGKAFDVPLIETRYQFHRIRSPFGALAHVDMLFPARRLWKRRHGPVNAPRPSAHGLAAGRRLLGGGGDDESPGSCSLTALERDILGLVRHDDVPGWEIPTRYFGYARTGDAAGLAGVLEHNRLDLISLGAVAATILEMASEGARTARERPDCLALGRLLESLGRIDDAERCFCAAAETDGMLATEMDRFVRAEALHWLALHRRRAHRFEEAAAAWHDLAQIPGLDADRRREALEALAIHHEHRAKDLEAARACAMSALQLASDARRVDEVRHRLGRLSRKMAGKAREIPLPTDLGL